MRDTRPTLTPGGRGPGAVAHQVGDAALPGRALEGLRHRPHEAWVGVGGDERHARHAAVADRAQERQPGVVALGVHDRDAQHVPPAPFVAADRGHDCRGRDPALAPALDVGGVYPEVGHAELAKRPGDQLLDLGVEALAYGADLVLREPLDAHGLRRPLHLPGAGAGRVHLGDRRHDGPVHPLVALQHVVGEEAVSAGLKSPQKVKAK